MIHRWSRPGRGFALCLVCLCRVRMAAGARGAMRLEYLPASASGWRNAMRRAPRCVQKIDGRAAVDAEDGLRDALAKLDGAK